MESVPKANPFAYCDNEVLFINVMCMRYTDLMFTSITFKEKIFKLRHRTI